MEEKEDFSDEEYDNEAPFLSRVVGGITAPFRVLISNEAQKAYLGTFLFLVTSVGLFFVAAVGYWIFYSNYIPQIGLERVVHLQFSDGAPWGTATLGSGLTSLQQYDVSVSLHLPRTPTNLATGNFMLDLTLLSPHGSTGKPNVSEALIANSRRPAILTYSSPLVDTARKVSRMPLYIVGLQREEEKLEVQMMEDVEFSRGWRNIPSSLKLEIHSREQMQVYDVRVKFKARFTGLRWLMYNWRILSFFTFTSMFWSVSMISASVTWLSFSAFLKSRDRDDDAKIKKEDDEGDINTVKEESDTLRGKSEEKSIKDEEEIEESTGMPPFSTDYTDYQDDSGLGTGLDRQTAQRRRSHLQDQDDE